MVHVHCVIMMAVLFLAKTSVQCNHGEVRLVNGHVQNEGRVEVCACIARSCSWGTVCDDDWDNSDAQVVCRQLGYRPDGAQALDKAHFGQGYGDIVLDNVRCDAHATTLLQCCHRGLFRHNCGHDQDAGVRCSQEEERLTNISANIIDVHTVLVTWMLQNSGQHWPIIRSYVVECFCERHQIEMSVNNVSFNIQLMGLLPTTSYNCCVSAVYEFYTTRGVCIETATIQPPTSQPSKTPVIQPSESPTIQLSTCMCETQGSNLIASSSADTIGGVLGFIIAILLILLAISGAALVFLLRQRCLAPKKSVDRNSTDVPVRRSLSYAITPSHSTTSGFQAAQATRAAGQSETDATANYSRIGPSYETTDSRRQQPAVAISGRNQVSARLSERYEFSDAHLAAAGGSDSAHGTQGDVGMDYEVPQSLRQIEEHEEYSYLQH